LNIFEIVFILRIAGLTTRPTHELSGSKNMLKIYAEQGRYSVFKIADVIANAHKRGYSLSLIRLGDGEGRLLGYPDFITKSELDKSLSIWFGRTNFDSISLIKLSSLLRNSVRKADIIGVPRAKQQVMSEYKSVIFSIRMFNLIDDNHILTDAAIHRYMQVSLLYRKILFGIDFCGLITCRDISDRIKNIFKIKNITEYLIPSEYMYLGNIDNDHFPERFESLKKQIKVPYPGAIFLVGAGALGKIYCHWIKEAGGIAIDIGSIFDIWAGIKSRPRFCYGLDDYESIPMISIKESMSRYNSFCDEFNLDCIRMVEKDFYEAENVSF